jgi:hypothetical protein
MTTAPKGTGTLDSREFAKHLLAHGANPTPEPGDLPRNARPGTRITTSSRARLASFSRQKRPIFPYCVLLLAAVGRKAGSRRNRRSDRNETALHRAACRAVDSVVQYPADKGAILDMSHACRMTPLDIWWMVYRSPLILGRSHREDRIFRSHRGFPQEVDGRWALLKTSRSVINSGSLVHARSGPRVIE